MRVGTDFCVLVSVEIGAFRVQIKSQFQYGRGSWSDMKLLSIRTGSSTFRYFTTVVYLLMNLTRIGAWSDTDIECGPVHGQY